MEKWDVVVSLGVMCPTILGCVTSWSLKLCSENKINIILACLICANLTAEPFVQSVLIYPKQSMHQLSRR